MLWDCIFRLLLAGVLGGVIGWDREYRAKEAGLRTHFFLTSSMRTPKPIIKQWCDPLMTFHKHCSCYSLLTLR